MSDKLSISDFSIGGKVTDVPLALKEFEQKVSRQGKPYYNINLGDKTGEIRGKVWTENMNKVDDDLVIGQIVEVTGDIQEYAGKPQIIIEKLIACTDMAPEDFLPVSSRDRSHMQEVMEQEIQKTANPHLKKILENFWNNTESRDKYVNFPAAEYVHHSYVGGLLEHTYEMWMLGQPFLQLYPQIDRDLFFTGLFFHDVGKIEELDIVGAAIIRTTAGKLVAHIGQGLVILDRLIKDIPDFPEDLRDKLFHLILSHQGKLEFGSPVKPQMIESLVLSMVDVNSADMNQATKHIEKFLETGEEFTDYHKWLGRSLYKKDYIVE